MSIDWTPKHRRDIDPLALKRVLWPDVVLYDKQVEIVYSVEDNDETYVPAANMLGKDFVAGFIVVSRFLRSFMRRRTCRVVTTSVAAHHLAVLWGEIGRFVTTARQPLLFRQGGPLAMNHMELRYASEQHARNPLSYAVGRVSEKGEGLAGHHAQDTLGVGDEASGIDDRSHEMFQGWAKRMLFIGNCNDTQNFFRRGIEGGDLLAPEVDQPQIRLAPGAK